MKLNDFYSPKWTGDFFFSSFECGALFCIQNWCAFIRRNIKGEFAKIKTNSFMVTITITQNVAIWIVSFILYTKPWHRNFSAHHFLYTTLCVSFVSYVCVQFVYSENVKFCCNRIAIRNKVLYQWNFQFEWETKKEIRFPILSYKSSKFWNNNKHLHRHFCFSQWNVRHRKRAELHFQIYCIL